MCAYAEEDAKYSNLSLIKFDRHIIKQSVMTKVYNVTTYGISKQLESKMEIVDEENELVKEIKANLKGKAKDNKYFYAPGIKGPVLV